MVLGVSSRALLGACERLGLDGGALLAAAGIDRGALDDPDARLPRADHRAVIVPRNMSIAQW